MHLLRHDPRWARAAFVPVLVLVLFLTACAEDATPPAEDVTAAARAAPTTFTLPTLYPTATRARQQPTVTREMPATRPPESTADLQQTVVSFRYVIPALGLDRRLEGTVGGTVTVVDEAAGIAATLQNQGGVLFELQSALPKLELAETPTGCVGCVVFAYSLPIDGQEDSGWLQDPVMLASVENYLAIALGPHWPEGTVAGLRRSASPYHVAHTVAVSASGEMYRWLATEQEVRGAEPGALPPLPDAETTLASEYRVVCPGSPLETLYLAAPDGEEADATSISITCPAFSLPTALLPVFRALDGALAPLLADGELPIPPSEIPLATMLVYERAGDGRLLLLMDDLAWTEDGSGNVVTHTLEAGAVISITAALEASEVLAAGVTAYTAAEAAHILLVRTAAGMAEAAWDASPPAALAPAVDALETLWQQLAPDASPTAESAATSEAGVTPTPAATGTAAPQATATP
ncbi:MAG: hypothetical protein RRC07_06540 [Anaerolineae bacterium]|nr:hypothetical protein [Anaerolineae bacterium]